MMAPAMVKTPSFLREAAANKAIFVDKPNQVITVKTNETVELSFVIQNGSFESWKQGSFIGQFGKNHRIKQPFEIFDIPMADVVPSMWNFKLNIPIIVSDMAALTDEIYEVMLSFFEPNGSPFG
jgi:hypothetical protein